MLFHIEEDEKKNVTGWVLPDNPSSIPRVKILHPDREPVELEANVQRTDLQDRSLHESGMAGFFIDEKIYPELSKLIEQIEIREEKTNILVFRKFQETKHLPVNLFRFELQAMPDPAIEMLFAKHFALYYGTAQIYPQDTFFGIVNNQASKSIYVAGRPNLQQYEQWLRERNYKIITLVRNPYEEMAERLLFARYASNPNIPAFVKDHMFGIEPLMDLVKDVKFDDMESLRGIFTALTDQQKAALGNPLVRTLACTIDDRPKSAHVEIALAKLSRMDVVGLRSRFGEFKSMLHELLGIDILGDYEPSSLSWVQRVAESLSQIKQARSLVALDLDLYSFVEEAVVEAIGPAATGAAGYALP